MSFAVVPPHNLEAEQAVLGAVLLADSVMDGLLLDELLRPEHFYREQHELVFRRMVELHDRSRPIDVLTVAEALDSAGELVRIGGPAMVDALAGAAPAAGNVREYARIVTDRAMWRTRLQAGMEIVASAHERSKERFEGAEQLIARADRPETSTYDAEALATMVFDYLSQRLTGVVLPTPWPRLNDRMAGGFRVGDTTVVAGWTNVGKSIVIRQLLEGYARQGLSAHLYTNEETPLDWMLRSVSASTLGLSFHDLLSHPVRPIDEGQARKVMEALNHFSQLRIGVTVCSGWPVNDIDRHLRRNRYDVAAVDIVNRVPHETTQDMDNISRTLNSAARVSDTHVFVAAHLNQGRNQTAIPPAPTLRDIRETGSLANDANNVLFVHREFRELTVVGGGGTGRFEPGPDGRLYFAKARNGLLGGVDVLLNPHNMGFEEA